MASRCVQKLPECRHESGHGSQVSQDHPEEGRSSRMMTRLAKSPWHRMRGCRYHPAMSCETHCRKDQSRTPACRSFARLQPGQERQKNYRYRSLSESRFPRFQKSSIPWLCAQLRPTMAPRLVPAPATRRSSIAERMKGSAPCRRRSKLRLHLDCICWFARVMVTAGHQSHTTLEDRS